MSRLRILPVSLAALCITLGKAHAQYAYVKHSEVLVQRGATTAVLPENRLRAFVYCVVTSPGKSEPLAPSVVTMGDATTGVAVHYPDRPPQPWGNTGAVWVFSDQIAMISCVEFAIPPYRTPHRETNPTGLAHSHFEVLRPVTRDGPPDREGERHIEGGSWEAVH